jgi:hypothetical protein
VRWEFFGIFFSKKGQEVVEVFGNGSDRVGRFLFSIDYLVELLQGKGVNFQVLVEVHESGGAYHSDVDWWGSFGYEIEALRSDRALCSVAVLEAVGGVEGEGIGGEADADVVTAQPWNSEDNGIVTESGDEEERLLQVLADLKLRLNIVCYKARGNGAAVYDLKLTRITKG